MSLQIWCVQSYKLEIATKWNGKTLASMSFDKIGNETSFLDYNIPLATGIVNGLFRHHKANKSNWTSHCSMWNITPPVNTTTWKSGELGQSFGCSHILLLRNGGVPSYPLVGRYCGNTIPPSITSFSNQLYVRCPVLCRNSALSTVLGSSRTPRPTGQASGYSGTRPAAAVEGNSQSPGRSSICHHSWTPSSSL